MLNRFTQFWEIPHLEYRDVFVGGGSTFFGKPKSQKNWINDFDEEVAAFFVSMRDYPNELCNLVMSTKPTVELWRSIKDEELNTDLEKGFRTLFLNRTTFSGILKGNPIGGIEQKSIYTIDCRWNPNALCKQILLCSEMLQGVKITSLDFTDIIEKSGENVLLYLDPPYYHKGNLLYRHGMTTEDHRKLSNLLKDTKHNFFITYDDCKEIRELYQEWAYLYPASWFYSSSNKKAREVGKELFISNFEIPEQIAYDFGLGRDN
ncbi:DNA adenine methylase [Paenibacillus motobuensis]|uniref:DNA adenine methylase n=1 Tax=Paenibacillus motobuensis TaxID=295324 RepID=UPI0036425548